MNNRYYLGLTPSLRLPALWHCALGGARGQNLGHLFAFIFSFMESFVNEKKVLFRVDFLSVTSDHRFKCHRVGLGFKI